MMPRCFYVSFEVIYTSMIQFNASNWAYFITYETTIISQTKISHNLNKLYEPKVMRIQPKQHSVCEKMRETRRKMKKTDRVLSVWGVCLRQTLGGVSPGGRIAVVRWRQNHHVVLRFLMHEVGHALAAHRRVSNKTTTHNHVTIRTLISSFIYSAFITLTNNI